MFATLFKFTGVAYKKDLVFWYCFQRNFPPMYLQSKFGIPILKQYTIYALETMFLELGSEDKVKITVTPETVCDTLRPQGVSTH